MTITPRPKTKILVCLLAIAAVVGWLIYLAQPSQEVKDIDYQREVIEERKKLREQLNIE